jgi:DNA end-binding protein Ku
MLRMATQLVDSLTTDWNPRRYHDTFTEELRERIDAKRAGKKLEIEPEEGDESKVVDLMQALEESVKGAQGSRRGRRKPRGRARKSA